ncbi:MAG: endonuclease domain-containing protein [Burkholderiales bacterium]
MTEGSQQLLHALAKWNPVPELAIGPFNIDLAIPSLQVAIELDGGDWHFTGKTRQRDAVKESLLRSQGWLILRINGPGELDYLVTALNRIGPLPIH